MLRQSSPVTLFEIYSAALPRVPLLPIGMVVGDPDSHGTAAELAAARIEAFAVHRSFYCGSRYLGRRRWKPT